ncbi:TPA: M9 family metallopeptidase N-terminal domain-containing protein, partial [archaeon]|nr:M9 family metallopeptidase N-terminal domain-containing protein [Candidatus Naiadarchaeum limnaeum]
MTIIAGKLSKIQSNLIVIGFLVIIGAIAIVAPKALTGFVVPAGELNRVDQVTADFHNTRLGVNAVCTLLANQQVGCNLQLTTTLYKSTVADSILAAALSDSLAELQNSVYKIRPSYYSNFSCIFLGVSRTIPYGANQKYMLRDVKCILGNGGQLPARVATVQNKTNISTITKTLPRISTITTTTPPRPKENETLFSNSVDHGRQDIIDYRIEPGKPRGPTGPDGSGSPGSCKIGDIVSLTPPELVSYLKSHDYDCLQFLWNYNNDVRSVLSEQNMLAVLREIALQSATYDGTNQNNLRELIFFVRIAYYHKIYHPSDIQFSANVDQSIINAFNVFSNNAHFNDFNDEAALILNEWVITVDTASLGHIYFDKLKTILSEFESNPARVENFNQRVTIYSILYLISRTAGYDSNFNAKMDQEMINLLQNLATNLNIASTHAFLVNNAIWALGHIPLIQERRDAAIAALTVALDTHPRLSEPYLWVVYSLDKFANCQTSRPNERICRSDLIPEIERMLFPNHYVFDDGALIVNTSLSLDTIQPLYHAIKQVESQFNRITETIVPLRGDPNGVLKMIIYGSLQDYQKYQWFLYDLPVTNGGIYIEQNGTFYTYQRTAAESIYTLEDLTRHEYSHYL